MADLPSGEAGSDRPLRGPPRSGADPRTFELSLLGAFALTDGHTPIALAAQPQRLVALLAIRDREVTRAAIAGALWPESTDEHAHASLRTLLSRFDETARPTLDIRLHHVGLSPSVSVDFHDARALAHRLLALGSDEPTEDDLSREALRSLSLDLLPDWYDEWLEVESTQWRALRLSALEALAGQLLARGQLIVAQEAANQLINADPLSPSGHEALIRTHLAKGERAKAIESFARYRDLLAREMHIAPSRELAMLVSDARPGLAGSSVLRLAQTAVAGEETTAFEVVAAGISMEPSIRHGDKLFVSQDVSLEPGRIVVAIHGELWIVKRLVMRDGELVLRSDNADEEVSLADVQVQGVVVELRRNL